MTFSLGEPGSSLPGSNPPGVIHFVVTRTVLDRSWFTEQYRIGEELARTVLDQAAARGLSVDRVGDLRVESGADGSWARLTREATAHYDESDPPQGQG